MGFDKNSGISKLAQIMVTRMKKESEQSMLIEFGTIESGYNLRVDTFPALIPKSDYVVCRSLTYGKPEEKLAGIEQTVKEICNCYVEVPEKMRSLQPGDRVLVLWLGADAVVVDIVMPATAL